MTGKPRPTSHQVARLRDLNERQSDRIKELQKEAADTRALLHELIVDAELVDDVLYGYLVSPSIIKKLKEEILSDAGT